MRRSPPPPQETQWLAERCGVTYQGRKLPAFPFFVRLESPVPPGRIVSVAQKQDSYPIMSQEEFGGLQATLELLSAPGFREAFEAGRKEAKDTLSFEDVFGEEQ